MGCYRLHTAELIAQGHTFLATPDAVEQALLFEGGPDAVCVWRHCLRQAPGFRLYIDQLASVLPISADRIRRAFAAMERQGVAWRTVGERDALGRLAGSHWNVSSLPRTGLEAAPAPDSPTPPIYRGSVNPALTKNKDREVTEIQKPSVYTREAFERLWRVYPQKANEAGAYKVFAEYLECQALSEEQIDQFLTICINDIQRRLSDAEWNAGGEFVPHLANYIRGRRWRDPPRSQVAAVKAAGLKPYRARQTRDVPLAELVMDDSWAHEDAQEAPEQQFEGQSPAPRSNSLPALLRALSEGSDHELERPRDSQTYRAQPRDPFDFEPAGDPGAVGGGHGGVFEIWPEDYGASRPWS